ncbi:MAG: ribosome biogenesis GTPase Der [Candidatus Shikimatogenerans bostrichidophilus]|nr:MAG: ribosome biogenesis GTPase Der [Candidatus Shikimatogenerans bostrichidophilus]
MNKIITLIGKSNVGKSTLFNFLIRKKQSLINKDYNTTRNRNHGILKIKDKYYDLIDTAGYIGKNLNKNNINKILTNQIILSIKESNLILFCVDIIDGINYLDKELFLIIKKYNKNFFYLINKIDIKTKYNNIYKILNFNIDIKKIYYISSTHNIGVNKLLKDINFFFKKEKRKKKQKQKNIKRHINISIIGLPNSGKSTFINSFFLEKNKSIVSDKAGTTIDTLYFKYIYKNYIYTFIDTPGIKKNFKYKKEKKIYLLNTKRIIKESDICLLIIDILEKFNKNTLYIKDLIIKYKKAIIIIFNKCDLLNKKKINLFKNKYLIYINKYIPVFFLSLKYTFNKTQKKKINKLINLIYFNRNKKFSTSFLNNKLLLKINNKNFKIKNRIFKIKFCYQSKNKKFPYFIFITNLVKNINLNYIKYIESLIRKHIFYFYGVPIELIFKKNYNAKYIFYKK